MFITLWRDTSKRQIAEDEKKHEEEGEIHGNTVPHEERVGNKDGEQAERHHKVDCSSRHPDEHSIRYHVSVVDLDPRPVTKVPYYYYLDAGIEQNYKLLMLAKKLKRERF